MRNIKWFILTMCIAGFGISGNAQEPIERELKLSEAIQLGLENHQLLKIAQSKVALYEQQTSVVKQQRLPMATLSANAFYLGDARIYNTDLSHVQTVDMPNFGNTYGVQASQLLYKGGVIKKSIEMSELQTQIATLDLRQNEQDIKFLITSNYLDIYKILNQIQVLEQNKALSEDRLENINDLYAQEMVTRNEVIRAELLIKNLEQSILTMKNNHAVISNQMSYALGLPKEVLIIPTEKVEEKLVSNLDYYIDLAHGQNPILKSAKMNIAVADKNISLTKTDWFPALAAFGGYNMQRPLTTSIPVLDLYNNTYQAGISLTYNLDNLYKTKRKIQLGEIQKEVTQEAFTYVNQNIEIGVNAAFVKYKESILQAELMEESKMLATENYNIIESKYLNQLAITAEMTDATNAKLEADLQYANASLNVLFQYYNLLKSTGTL
ncbi:TolC family protein [Brumimicrobium glaciale]|uniref:TolC family protein n=1 Tax=Brumimicrobium glaciale TaxID=200475 RepID=A0A4V1WG81_9FLAO|nr:TolC family protein [Brumimicrobium glaciale]RYM35781.1 TolC family protein [Brumimicrobium glaciale]